ncbi:hypothetical protein D3C75_1318890 [compost metagenome]
MGVALEGLLGNDIGTALPVRSVIIPQGISAVPVALVAPELLQHHEGMNGHPFLVEEGLDISG